MGDCYAVTSWTRGEPHESLDLDVELMLPSLQSHQKQEPGFVNVNDFQVWRPISS